MKNLLSNSSRRIQLVDSGKSRTAASLNAFVEGLPLAAKSLIDYELANPNLLSFYDSNKYQMHFKKEKFTKAKLQSIQSQPYTKRMITYVLERLYHRSFIERLINGSYSIIDHESGRSIKNEIDAARMLHGVYLIGPNLLEEGVESLLEKYLTLNESSWFAYIQDAKVNISL